MADDKAPAAEEKDKKDAAPPEGGEAAAEGEGAAPAGGNKKKLILFGVIGFAAILIVGAAAWFFLGGKDGEAHADGELAGVVYVEVSPMAMNMAVDSGGEHFLKVRAMLELATEEDKAKATALLPRLQDDWNAFLRQMRPEDVQGSSAIQRLKEGMLLRANQALAPVPVKQVLLTELLVQ